MKTNSAPFAPQPIRLLRLLLNLAGVLLLLTVWNRLATAIHIWSSALHSDWFLGSEYDAGGFYPLSWLLLLPPAAVGMALLLHQTPAGTHLARRLHPDGSTNRAANLRLAALLFVTAVLALGLVAGYVAASAPRAGRTPLLLADAGPLLAFALLLAPLLLVHAYVWLHLVGRLARRFPGTER